MSNDFLPFATAGTPNVISQAAYAALAARGTGFVTGTALSNQLNKVWRQSAFQAAVVAQFVANVLSINVNDDGDLATAVANFTAAVEALVTAGVNVQVGDIKTSLNPAPGPGWVVANDGTIGSATSGATTRANADCQALFEFLWNTYSNAFAPVGGGRGGSAAADWAANKTIQTGFIAGRVLGGEGTGAGLTARAAGAIVGAESTTDVIEHAHLNGVADDGGLVFVYNSVTTDTPGNATSNVDETVGSATHQGTTSVTGNVTALGLIQPTTFIYVYLHL